MHSLRFLDLLAMGAVCAMLTGCGKDDTPVDAHSSAHDLAQQGRTEELFNSLLGQPVDARDVCYRTPLMLAAQSGHLDTVRQLIAAGARVELHEKGYYSALMLAAGNGHAEIVELLARAGANVNDVEITRGWTALIWAAQRGHVETVKQLLELGADPSVRDRQGRSALDWARLQRQESVISLLQARSA